MAEFAAPPKVHILHVPGADPLRDEIVTRLVTEGEACLHHDPNRSIGCMGNWLLALACARRNDTDLSWSVILSDDADPLRGWQQHLERACNNSPEPFLGLTHFGGFGTTPLEHNIPYGVGPYLVWGGAIGYHRSVVDGLYEWADSLYAETGWPHDDWAVMGYAKKIGVKTALAARAIFGQPVKKSLLNHNTPIREPKTTIANCAGPPWSSRPRGHKVARTVPDKVPALAEFTPRRSA